MSSSTRWRSAPTRIRWTRLSWAALNYGLTETVPSLRRLITGRVGFSNPQVGQNAEIGAVLAVRALAKLEGASAREFLVAELDRATATGLPSPHDRHHRPALLGGVLLLSPDAPVAIAATRELLQGEVQKIQDGMLQRFPYADDVAAILWAVEHARIHALLDDLRPFARFGIPPPLAASSGAGLWTFLQEDVRKLLG